MLHGSAAKVLFQLRQHAVDALQRAGEFAAELQPFLALGGVVAALWGRQFLAWYLG